MDLHNKVGIITGASRGIGVRIAEALARKGVHLALAARSTEGLEGTADGLGRYGVRSIAVPTDVTDRDQLQRLVDTTSERLGPPDLLINNAGIECVGYFEKLDEKLIEDAIATNLAAVVMLTRMVVPGMLERGGGHICNIASTAGKVARPYGVVYSATKHAVVGFSWSLRAEMIERGIEVSVVCPHYVTGEGMFTERESTVAGRFPRGMQPVTPQHVAEKTVWAIENNKAETVVGPALIRSADIFHALSPQFAIRTGHRSGLFRFTRKEATGD